MTVSYAGQKNRERLAVPWIASGLLLAAMLCAGGAQAQTLLVTTPAFPLTPVGQSVTENVSFQINTGGNRVVFNSIVLASGFNDFTLGAITGCVVDGSTVNTDGTICMVPVTFSPTLPGNAGAPVPIARSAPLLVNDVENGALKTYAFGLVGSGTQPQPVLVPGIISDIVGNDLIPIVGFSGDGGPASQAEFNGPTNLAVDVAGNIYISDTGNCVVRRVDATTHIVTTVAGTAPSPTPNCGVGTDGVAPTSSMLNGNTGIALDAAGNLYIADTGNHAIRMVSSASGLITTVAGTLGSAGFSGDGAAATAAHLTSPMGVTVDGYGDLFIADTGNFVVREVSAIARTIVTIAGVGGQQGIPASTTGVNGPPLSFNFYKPQAVAVDSSGNVYVADTGWGNLWQVPPGGTTITSIPTLIGSPPVSVSVDASDAVYYATLSTADCSVYKTLPLSGMPIWLAGYGTCLGSGDGGDAAYANLNYPKAVVPDGAGNLYILEVDGVRFVNSSLSATVAAPFGSVNIGVTASPLSFEVFDGDVAPLSGASPNTMSVYFGQPLSLPFFAAPPVGQDCSQSSLYLYPGAYCTMSLDFAPTADGPFNGSTTLESYLNGQPVLATFNLTGTGQGPSPTATLLPGGPLTFSAVVKEAASAAQMVVLKNTSTNITLTISGIGFANAGTVFYVPGFSQTNNCGTTLVAGATCNIEVTFQTNSAGTFAQQLIVTDDTAAGQQVVALNGTSLAPVATLSTNAVGFGSTQYYGTVSPGQPVTLSNTGTAPLNISSITLGGTFPGEFSINTSSCPASLAVGGSCQIEVYFQPDAAGAFIAFLLVNDDSGGQRAGTTVQQSVYIAGTSPTTVQASIFTIANTIFAPTPVSTPESQIVTLTLGSPETIFRSIVIGPGTTQYSVGAITGCIVDGSTSNAGGLVCQISVIFSPTLVGYSLSGTLLVTTIENGLPVPYSFSLTGTSNGAIAALTPGIIYPYLAGYNTGSGGGVCLAGTGCTATGFGQSAISASVGYLNGQTIDPFGNLFVSDSYYDVVYKIDTSGVLSLYAGRPFVTGGSSQILFGDGGPAVDANIANAGPMATDNRGNLFLSNTDNFGHATIRRIDVLTHVINTVVGSTAPGSWTAFTAFPVGSAIAVTVSGTQYLFLAKFGGITGSRQPTWPTAAGATVQDSAVNWENQGVYPGNPGCAAQTDVLYDGCLGTQGPAAGGWLATDNEGNLYFSEGAAIQEWNAVSGILSLRAGGPSGVPGTNPDNGGLAVGATINASDLIVDQNNNIYFIDNGLKVRKVTTGGVISTVAGINKTLLPITSPTSPLCQTGTGSNYPSGDGGLATAAGFGGLSGIALDQADDLYLVDGASCQVRRIDSGTQIINTVAGQNSFDTGEWGNLGDPYLQADGSAVLAGLASPKYINLDAGANMYIMGVLDVRKINVSQSVIDFSRTFIGGVIEPVGGSTGPMTATVLNAGNSGAITFNSPYTDPLTYGISTGDFTRDVGSADCITVGSINQGTECPVNIDFTPTVVGTPIADIDTIGDNAGTQNQIITLLGSSSPAAGITLTPHLLSFVSTVGTVTASQIFTLANNTTTSVPITSMMLIGSGAANFVLTNSCPTMLAANTSCLISVMFNPTALGQSIAQVSVTDTFAGAAITQLGGLTGLAATALGEFLDENPDTGPGHFGAQNIDVPTTPHTFTFKSYGAVPLLISSITITGPDAVQYSISGTTCGASLAPQQTCTISVVFNPLVDSPNTPATPFHGILTVTDNATNSPQQAGLSGFGVGVAPTPFPINETIHLTDAPTTPVVTPFSINELIHTSDSTGGLLGVQLSVTEAIHVIDTLTAAESVLLPITELIHVIDTPMTAESVLLPITESIHILDTVATHISATTPVVTSTSPSVNYGTSSATLSAMVAYTGAAAPTGGLTFLVNNSATGVGTVSCTGSTSPVTCTASYATSTLGVNTYAIKATLAADTNYATTFGTGTLTVSPTTPVITVSNMAVSYGISSANLSASVAYTGAVPTGVVTFKLDSGATVSANCNGATSSETCTANYATSALGAGSHTITASLAADSNYNVSSNTGALTVTAVAPTITFSVPNHTYGDAVFTVIASSDSTGAFTYSVVSGSASIVGSTVTITGMGAVTLQASEAAGPNYTTGTTQATFTITQGQLTVTATAASRFYGSANPAFAGTITGADYSDGFTESFSTSATVTSAPGSYTIVPSASGANLNDYSVNIVDGTLTVSQAPTVTVLTASSSSITPIQTVTLTATSSSTTSGVPTGTVTLLDNGSPLTTLAMVNGSLSYTTTLSPGATHTLVATYSGDSNFVASASAANGTIVTVSAQTFTINLTGGGGAGSSNLTVAPGQVATYTFTISPNYGMYPGPATFSITGLPPGATATFTPSTVPANGGTQTIKLSIQTPQAQARNSTPGFNGRYIVYALLLLPAVFARRRRKHPAIRLLGILILLGGAAALSAVTGCGASGNGFLSQEPRTYPLTLTASSGSLQQSTTLTLTVQ
jgi:hypothetical protein